MDITHLQQVLHTIIRHGAPGKQEVGDVDISNTQLPVNLCQPPDSFTEHNLSSSAQAHLFVLASDGAVPLASGHLGLSVAPDPHVQVLTGAAQLVLDVFLVLLQPQSPLCLKLNINLRRSPRFPSNIEQKKLAKSSVTFTTNNFYSAEIWHN